MSLCRHNEWADALSDLAAANSVRWSEDSVTSVTSATSYDSAISENSEMYDK